MPALVFPVALPRFVHQNTSTTPSVESASATTCVARARYSPREYTYETLVRLQNGKWSVQTTTWPKGHSTSYDDYPTARGYQIALLVINWWYEQFHVPAFASISREIATRRATWLSRSAHKVLTEVTEQSEQLAALQMLAVNYGVPFSPPGATPTLKSAEWATNANLHLVRTIADDERRRAVALLVELVTGWKEGSPAHVPATTVASPGMSPAAAVTVEG